MVVRVNLRPATTSRLHSVVAGTKGKASVKARPIKGKGQNPDSTIREQSQITLGGARPVVEGQILNVQGDDYVIQDISGSEVRVRVNKDTNVECATGSGQGTSMSTGRHGDEQGEIPPTPHMQERMDQKQSTQSKSQEQKDGTSFDRARASNLG